METISIVPRQVIETGEIELFFVNWWEEGAAQGQYWWIDGYSLRDGTFQANRDYIRKKTRPLQIKPKDSFSNDSDIYWKAFHIAEAWNRAVPGLTQWQFVTQLRGPKGYTYGG